MNEPLNFRQQLHVGTNVELKTGQIGVIHAISTPLGYREFVIRDGKGNLIRRVTSLGIEQVLPADALLVSILVYFI